MSTEAILLTKINEITETVKTQGEAIEALRKPQYKNGTPAQLLGGAPRARHGEDPMSSRGYSYAKLLGLLAGQLGSEDAKLEIDVHDKPPEARAWPWDAVPSRRSSELDPLAVLDAAPEHHDRRRRRPGPRGRRPGQGGPGVTGYDSAEVRAVRRKHWGVEKAMSWVDDPSGGALVGPPVMGELIDILRNNEAFLARPGPGRSACRRRAASPSRGRRACRRPTGWARATAVTESQPTVGDLVLTAKKLGVMVPHPQRAVPVRLAWASSSSSGTTSPSVAVPEDGQDVPGRARAAR
jgi:hypothetical protein